MLMLLLSQERPKKMPDGLIKHASCVNTTDRIYLHQMLRKQSLKDCKNQILISRHKTNITSDLYL